MASNAQFAPSTGAALVGQVADGLHSLVAGSAIAAGDLVSIKDSLLASTVLPAINGIGGENNATVYSQASQSPQAYGAFSAINTTTMRRLDNDYFAFPASNIQAGFTLLGPAGEFVKQVLIPNTGAFSGLVQLYPVPGGQLLVTWIELISSVQRYRFAIYNTNTFAFALSPTTAAVPTAVPGNTPAQAYLNWVYQPNGGTPYIALMFLTPGSTSASVYTYSAATGAPLGTPASFNLAFPVTTGRYIASLANANGDITYSIRYQNSNGLDYHNVARWNGATQSPYNATPLAITSASYTMNLSPTKGQAAIFEQSMAEAPNGNVIVITDIQPSGYTASGRQPCAVLIGPGNPANLTGAIFANTILTSAGLSDVGIATAVIYSPLHAAFLVFAGFASSDSFCMTFGTTAPMAVSAKTAVTMGALTLVCPYIYAYSGGIIFTQMTSDGSAGYAAHFDGATVTKRGNAGPFNTYAGGNSEPTAGPVLPMVPQATPGLVSFAWTDYAAYASVRRHRLQASSIFGVAQASAAPGERFPCATKGTFTIPAAQSFGNAPIPFNQQGTPIIGNKGILVGNTVSLLGIHAAATVTPIN
jgi:hypothetical protein